MNNMTTLAALALQLLLLPFVVSAHEGEGNAVVQAVTPGSPAERAGLKAEDTLLEIAGEEIATLADLTRVLEAHEPGDTVPLVVERKGERIELELTFGTGSGGGVSVGVSLAIASTDPAAVTSEQSLTRAACLEWVDATYQVATMTSELRLQIADEVQEVRVCLERNVQQMPSPMPKAYCDNAFKIHCSGLDLLTEIGEALVARCSAQLGEPLSSCAELEIFDRYSRDGLASDEASCCKAQKSCG